MPRLPFRDVGIEDRVLFHLDDAAVRPAIPGTDILLKLSSATFANSRARLVNNLTLG
jgi:hypothetical protein